MTQIIFAGDSCSTVRQMSTFFWLSLGTILIGLILFYVIKLGMSKGEQNETANPSGVARLSSSDSPSSCQIGLTQKRQGPAAALGPPQRLGRLLASSRRRPRGKCHEQHAEGWRKGQGNRTSGSVLGSPAPPTQRAVPAEAPRRSRYCGQRQASVGGARDTYAARARGCAYSQNAPGTL
jgi:hypothetical protein